MSRNKRRETVKTAVWRVLLLSVVFAAMWQLPAFAEEAEEAVEYTPALFATAWALLPPLVAISLALITKEVYSSLFIGIVVGGILYSGGKFEGTVIHVFYAKKMGEKYLKRYFKYFANPDIREFDLQHEELLACYPYKWAQLVKSIIEQGV